MSYDRLSVDTHEHFANVDRIGIWWLFGAVRLLLMSEMWGIYEPSSNQLYGLV